MKKIRTVLLSCLCTTAIATPAYAQNEADADDNVIIVTAQKREQNLQDVSVSVQVVTDELLENRNLNQVEELNKLAPGFTVASGGNDAGRSLAVRGVGTQSFSRAVDQSVGLVVDGVSASSLAAALLDFSDVERIEVLRGPQGMLFGKNASAGLLNITTKNPTDYLEIGGGFTLASAGERKLDAHISGPIVGDTIMARVNYYMNKRDPLIRNINPNSPDLNDRDEWGLRAKLLIEPTEDFSALFIWNHAEREQNCCIAPAVVAVGPFNIPHGPENDIVNSFGSAPGRTNYDGYSMELNYDTGGPTITSVTAYSDNRDANNTQAFGLPIPVTFDNSGMTRYEQFTQELRLTSPPSDMLEYVAGLYYYKNDMTRAFQRILNGPLFGAPLNLSEINDVTAETESYAAFGQLTWHIGDQTRLLAGLRVNHDKVSVEQTLSFIPGTIPGQPLGTRSGSLSDTHLSWRFTLEQDITYDAMVYASVARGYKGPAGNTLNTGVTAPRIVIDPEVPTGGEIGIKSQFWDRRITLNASAFYTEFKDFQTSLSNGGVPAQFFLDNAGKLETKGIEVDLSVNPVEGLSLNAGLAYVDATFKDYTGAACYPGQTVAQGCVGGVQDLSGSELPNSPNWTVTLTGRYELEMDDWPIVPFVQGSYYHQSSTQTQTNGSPNTILPSYDLVDAAVGFRSPDDFFSVQFFVKNLLDDFYEASLSDAGTVVGLPLTHFLNYDYKRRMGLSLRLNF